MMEQQDSIRECQDGAIRFHNSAKKATIPRHDNGKKGGTCVLADTRRNSDTERNIFVHQF